MSRQQFANIVERIGRCVVRRCAMRTTLLLRQERSALLYAVLNNGIAAARFAGYRTHTSRITSAK